MDASKPNPCLKRGRDLYIDIPGSKFAVSSVLNTGYNGVAFIHPSYIKAGGRDWIDWLIRVLSVSDIPRIKEREESKLSLTFTSIIKSSPSKVFLKILTDYWSRYSMDITESIEKEISSARVDCSSGQRTLKETIAPLPSLIKRSKDLGGIQLPFLTLEASVDDPTSLECLQRFGVTITEDANFYMLILQSLRTQDQCTMDVVYSIYMLIGARLRVTRDSAQVV